jgi:NAD(P)-dependent dehydrogenase (short-subunit alcohol dehydrogenase family)
MRLGDQVAVVTGAGRGICQAIACAFAAEGARVVVADIDADVAGVDRCTSGSGHCLECRLTRNNCRSEFSLN